MSSLPRLTMLGALAVAELVREAGITDVGIKWPNDVQINGLKVSGVLAEAEWRGDQLIGAVLGIGVNVRINFHGTDLENKAISLETALGQSLDRVLLTGQLLDHVDYWYDNLDSDLLFDSWKRRLLTLGKQVQIGAVAGVAESVDSDGALVVRDTMGNRHRVAAGMITD